MGRSEPAARALAGEALLAAQSGGAEYADVRVVEFEEERIYVVTEREVDWRSEHSFGIGVRVIAHGAWGFASQSLGEDDAGVEAAQAALRMAGKQNHVGGAPCQPNQAITVGIALRSRWTRSQPQPHRRRRS